MYQVFAFERVAMYPFLLEIQTCTKFCFWKSQEVSFFASGVPNFTFDEKCTLFIQKEWHSAPNLL